MNDVKTKLGQIETYEHDASRFKAELRSRLVHEYAMRVEENKGEYEPRSFRWRFAFVPVMAALTLIVFIGYEYLAQPLTAYAYLEEVERRMAILGGGVTIRLVQELGDTSYDIDVSRGKDGDMSIRVKRAGKVVEDVVVQEGVLYVANMPQVEVPADDLKENLTSIVNSLVIAEAADPRNELSEMMRREGVEIELLEGDKNGLVKVSYEEGVGDEAYRHEFLFRDFVPVERKTITLNEDITTSLRSVAQEVSTVSYKEFVPLEKEVSVDPAQYRVFVEDAQFTEKVDVLLETRLPDLAREYAKLPEENKVRYLDVWEDAEILSAPEVTAVMDERPIDAIPVLKVRLEPVEAVPSVTANPELLRDSYIDREFDEIFREVVEKKDEIPVPVLVVPEVKPDYRDALIDNSIPEPYMAEPIDPIILPEDKGSYLEPVIEKEIPILDTNLKTPETTSEDTPTYIEILEDRVRSQYDAAERRRESRMEKQEIQLKEYQPFEGTPIKLRGEDVNVDSK